MYLLAYSFLIPIIGILLPLFMQNDYGWVLTILFVILGLLFSALSLKERRDKWALGAMILNIVVVIYATIITIKFFMS